MFSSTQSVTVILSLMFKIALGSDGYCNWSNCDGFPQGGNWCNKKRINCQQGCGGDWCQPQGTTKANIFDKTTKKVPETPANVPCGNGIVGNGICQDSSLCCSIHGWCDNTEEHCRNSLTQPSSAPDISPTSSGEENETGSINPPQFIPYRSGSTKRATTTRYWDCSGGACGCAYLPSGDANLSAHCYSNAMFKAPNNNPYGAKFYGTAAISKELGGGNWMAEGCGKCWMVTGTSSITGTSITTTLVLKGANYCPPENPLCAEGKAHFDIAAPGFDVLKYSLSHTCDVVEAAELLGFQACSGWMVDSRNPSDNCNCNAFNDPVLRAGCKNFFSLKWDNTDVNYEEVSCPPELGQLPCWEENGNRYPDGVPALCADPNA